MAERMVPKRRLHEAEAQALKHRALAIKLGGIVKELQARGLVPGDLERPVTETLRRVEALEA